MRADIHYGQEHQSSTHGPDTDVQDQPSIAHIGLATHGRSIQTGSSSVGGHLSDLQLVEPREQLRSQCAASSTELTSFSSAVSRSRRRLRRLEELLPDVAAVGSIPDFFHQADGHQLLTADEPLKERGNLWRRI
jgi:hypothetical protein